MTRLMIRDRQDLVDLVTGCCFMGTGGGGSLMMGLKLLERAWEKGFKIEFLPPDEVPDQAWTCTGSFVGSIAPPPQELLDMEDALALRRTVEHEIVQAVKELKDYLGIEIYALAACELGGLNTPAPISAAAELGIPVLDGDYVGRAIPGSVHLKLSIAGKKLWPRVFCDRAGNVSIIKQASSHAMMERMQKHLSMSTIGFIGGAGHVLSGKEMKKIINHGSISRCLEIGRLLRKNRGLGGDMPQAVAGKLGGWVLFKGKVEEKPWESKLGYMFGEFHLSGIEQFSGHRFKVWFQNENMVSWLDDTPYVTCPDPICVVKLDDAVPATNEAIKMGDRLAVIGLKAVEFYRRPEGLKVLGPAYFGFDIPYRPIEEIMDN